MRNAATLLVLALLALPSPVHGHQHTDDAYHDAARHVSDLLAPGTIPAGVDRALAARAGLAAFDMLAQPYASQMADATWQAVQTQPDPHDAFVDRVLAHHGAVDARIKDLLASMTAAHAAGLTKSEADLHLATAHLLAIAEQDLYQFTEISRPDLQHSRENGMTRGQRELSTGPLFVADLHIAAAQHMLAESADTGAATVDTAPLERLLQDQWRQHGGPAVLPIYESASPWHSLARLVLQRGDLLKTNDLPQQYGGDFNNVTVADLRTDLDQFTGPQTVQSSGFDARYQTAVAHAATWWIDEAAEMDDGHQHGTVHARSLVQAAQYEAEVLAAAYPSSDAGAWFSTQAVLAIAALAAAGIAVAGGIAYRRRMTGALALSAVLLIAPLLALPTDVAAQEQAGTVPVAGPFSLFGHMAVLPNDTLRIVYVDGAAGSGRDMVHRLHDPVAGTWTDAAAIRLPASPALRGEPQIYAVGDDEWFVWNSNESGGDADRLYPHACQLVDGACHGDVVQLGRPQHKVIGIVQFAANDHGDMAFAWSEEPPGQDKQIYVARFIDGAWQPGLPLATGAELQEGVAVAISSDGTVHVAWGEDEPELACRGLEYLGCPVRLVHASISPASALAPAITLFDHHGGIVAASKSIVLVDEQPHIVYANKTRDAIGQPTTALEHRWREDDGNWTQPIVLPVAGSPQPDTMYIEVDGSDFRVFWHQVLGGTGGLYTISYESGHWLRPALLRSNDLRPQFMALGTDTGGTLHAVFTGEDPSSGAPRVYYWRTDTIDPYQPPEIGDITPDHETWTQGSPVNIRVTLQLSRPLDHEASRLIVDGITVPTRVYPTYVQGQVDNLPEGLHDASFRLADTAGGTAQRSWTFGVDRTKPVISHTATLVDGTAASGWSTQAVTIAPQLAAAHGAPEWVEVQVHDGAWERWGDLDERPTFEIPEGRLWNVRFRGVDAAGNVDVGVPFTVGWDDAPPRFAAQLPPWGTPDAPVQFTSLDGEDPGAPVVVNTTLVAIDSGATVPVADLRFPQARPSPLLLPSAPSGEYTVVFDLRDDAGNRFRLDAMPITFDVDAPQLSAASTAEGIHVTATDEHSGLTSLHASLRGRQWVEAGNGDTSLSIDLPDLDDEVLVTATDVAGNSIERRLTVTGDLVAAPAGDAAGQASGRDRGQNPEADDSGNGIPGPAVPVLLALFAGVAAGRRRQS